MNAIVAAVGLAAITCIDAMGASSAMMGQGARLLADVSHERHVAAEETVDPRIAAYDLGHACADAGGWLVREAGRDGNISYRCYIEAH